jgi:Tricorn protease C1 domain
MRCSKPLIALVCLALITCAAARAQSLSEPERNFEALWKTFDEKYSHFAVKNVDWQAVYLSSEGHRQDHRR